MTCTPIEVTLDGSGAADLDSAVPLSGEISEIRCSSTGLDEGGATDITITRRNDGAQVLKLTNVSGPWSKVPQQPVCNNEGGAALFAAGGTALMEEIPVDGYLRVQVAQGKPGGKATIFVYVD